MTNPELDASLLQCILRNFAHVGELQRSSRMPPGMPPRETASFALCRSAAFKSVAVHTCATNRGTPRRKLLRLAREQVERVPRLRIELNELTAAFCRLLGH